MVERDNKNIDSNELAYAFESFARHITPLPIEPKENNDEKHVKWGEDNLYPNFLIDIADKSALHGSILNSKSNYVYGDGVVDKKSGEFLADLMINEDDTLQELVQKCINDVMYFNSFAVEVTFNFLNEPHMFYHVPLHHVRMNKSKTKFFVNKDWKLTPRTFLSYPKYQPKNNDNTEPKIFYFNSYNVSVNNVYASQDYKCVEDAVTDMLISTLFKNNVANGFSLTKVVKTFKGQGNQESQDKTSKKFRNIFSGIEGENMLIEFNTANEKGLEIDTIEADDYASKLIEVIKKTERNILTAHSATSSILFGVEKEGSLGNATELENAYQLFKDNFVKNKRNEIVSAFNKLFQASDSIPVINIKDKEKLFKTELSSVTKEKIMTINELRVENGLEAIEGGDRFIAVNTVVNTIKEETQFSKKKDDELDSYSATLEDFEKVKYIGSDKNNFITIGKSQFQKSGKYEFASAWASIEEYLLENQIVGLTIDAVASKISEELEYTVSKDDVRNAIDLLKNAGLINTKENIGTKTISTTPKEIDGTKIEVYYDYVKRDEAEGNTILPTTRHFCKSIIDSNKYFSAVDIQALSSVLGYSVMEFGGGYWRDKNTGVVNKHCRHEFRPVKVYKK